MSSRSKRQKKNDRTPWIIAFVFLAALTIFCELSVFGLCGGLGQAIRRGLHGTFGLLGWIFPVLLWSWLFYIWRFCIAARKTRGWAVMKAVVVFVLFWDLCALIQHFVMPYQKEAAFADDFTQCSQRANGGGVFGAVIVRFLRPALGSVGLAFVLLIIGILLSELLTDGALLNLIRGAIMKSRSSETAPWEEEKLSRKRRKQEKKLAKKEQAKIQEIEKPLPASPVKKPAYESDPRYYDIKDTNETDLADHQHDITIHDQSVFETLDDYSVALGTQKGKTSGTSLSRSPEIVELSPGSSQKSNENSVPDLYQTVGDPDAPKKEQSRPARKTARKKPAVTEKESLETQKPPQTSKTASVSKPETMIVSGDSEPADADYSFPPYSLLARGSKYGGDSRSYLRDTAIKLEETLQSFGVNVTVTDVSCGPAVTRYELQPEAGVKVSRIVALESDIKLNLAASDIRIEAPIPGKAAVGIEVPNKSNMTVMLRDLLEDEAFKNHKSKIAFAAGRDIAGLPVIADIQKMPHVLIAGATGSGKSVCINTIIMSILYRARPDEVKMIMIDPKVVELSVYNNIPHLLIPVVTDPKKAAGALNWAVAEMTRRYRLFAEFGSRKIEEYNARIKREMKKKTEEDDEVRRPLPQIVIIVDELADLMMVSSKEVEDAIVRLTQLARAAGIHLVIATQRPSVNVITGLIKANMPSRIAFAVTSGVDSRTILDMNGAEKLLGKGDMLFYPSGYPKPVRVQGAFVSDQEVSKVVDYLIKHNEKSEYDEQVSQEVSQASSAIGRTGSVSIGAEEPEDDRDEYFIDAGVFIIEKEKASIGMLQRRFKIGFNRAARIMDQLCEAGVVGEEEGTKPRKVLMTSAEEFEQSLMNDE